MAGKAAEKHAWPKAAAVAKPKIAAESPCAEQQKAIEDEVHFFNHQFERERKSLLTGMADWGYQRRHNE